MKIERKYPLILELLNESQSVLVLGPRATGKTFFLSRLLSLFENKFNIDLLNNSSFERYIATPWRLYDEIEQQVKKTNSKLYIMIDEIQRIPTLLNEVHRAIENYKEQVFFIITGSSARKLKRDENANLLAGRAIAINFYPLSSLEIDLEENLEPLLCKGALPEVFLMKSEKIIFEKLKTYVGTYLTEEIQRESEIRKIDKFHKFLELSASINGSLVNYSKLARAVGVSAPTIKEYYSILRDTLIAYEVPAWTFSVKKQILQSSKYYFFDNGVLNAILGELTSKINPATYNYGKLFENLVVTEIIKLIDIKRLSIKCFNYRTTNDQEVDLILQRNAFSNPVAIEIKSATNPSIENLTALISFANDYPNSTCLVICRTPKAYQEGNITFYPLLEGINKAIELASALA